jgi:hypothetical protein
MFCSIDPSDLCAKNYIYPLLPARWRIWSLADNVYEYIYNILLPRNYKAWLQSSSSVEASLECIQNGGIRHISKKKRQLIAVILVKFGAASYWANSRKHTYHPHGGNWKLTPLPPSDVLIHLLLEIHACNNPSLYSPNIVLTWSIRKYANTERRLALPRRVSPWQHDNFFLIFLYKTAKSRRNCTLLNTELSISKIYKVGIFFWFLWALF